MNSSSLTTFAAIFFVISIAGAQVISSKQSFRIFGGFVDCDTTGKILANPEVDCHVSDRKGHPNCNLTYHTGLLNQSSYNAHRYTKGNPCNPGGSNLCPPQNGANVLEEFEWCTDKTPAF